MTRAAALFRLELADALRSRWWAATALVYAIVFGAFTWLGLRESSVLGFTGLSRVVLNVANAVVLTVPLVALVATSQSVVRARVTGLFELLLTQPVRRSDWLLAAIGARALVLVGPLVVMLLAALVAGLGVAPGDASLTPLVLRTLAVGGALCWAFVGLGFLISSIAASPERATVLALVVFAGASALHDFALMGALLRTSLPPKLVFGLAATNPVEAARIAILAGIDPELSVLGPIGFWLANTLGPARALVVGIGWPLVLGSGAVAVAKRFFSRADLAG
jgi:ABC-2 type transport system permease protein